MGIKRKQHCGTCDACTKDDCANCVNCQDIVKFGSTGRKKKCWVQRQCENIHKTKDKGIETQVCNIFIYSWLVNCL